MTIRDQNGKSQRDKTAQYHQSRLKSGEPENSIEDTNEPLCAYDYCRYFILTRDYLNCFKRSSGSASEKISDMGQFIFKVSLTEFLQIWYNHDHSTKKKQ